MDGQHIADAKDEATAELIADALNHAPACVEHRAEPYSGAISESGDWFDPGGYPDADYVQHEKPAQHIVQRQGDEYACSCAVRWSADEGEEHP